MSADERTIEVYDEKAPEYARRYGGVELPLWHRVMNYLKPGATVLDLGCGTGRDVAFLQKKGFDAYGVDASVGMIEAAKEAHPNLGNRFSVSSLPFSEENKPARKFAAVSLVAVLMHVPDEDLFSVFRQVRSLLAPEGVLVLSASQKRQNLDDASRDPTERLFRERPSEEYQRMLDGLGFQLLEVQEDEDRMGRSEVVWFSQIYRLKP